MAESLRSSDTCSYDLDGRECTRWPGYALVDACHPSLDMAVLMCWRHIDEILAFNSGENPEHTFTANSR